MNFGKLDVVAGLARALLAQPAARQSHNLKVLSSSLREGSAFNTLAPYTKYRNINAVPDKDLKTDPIFVENGKIIQVFLFLRLSTGLSKMSGENRRVDYTRNRHRKQGKFLFQLPALRFI